MAGYEDKQPFVPSLLVGFRKRLSGEILEEINEMIIECKDNIDRIEVKHKFSLVKRKFGFGLLHTKLAIITKASVVLSIIAMNGDRFVSVFLALYRLRFYVLLTELSLERR